MALERALEYVVLHRNAGHHVDSRVHRLLLERNPVEELHIEDEERFLKLQFHCNPASRLLAPLGEPRTLFDVASRMIKYDLTFESLTRRHEAFESSIHKPEWFEPCLKIQKAGIDPESFGCLFLMGLTEHELERTPSASYSIYDGTHRSLVMAYMVMTGATQFSGVNAFLFNPRPINA